MFQVNDVVIYGNRGVCKVTDIGTLSMSMADNHKKYYTLNPIYQKEAVIYVPVDNHKIIMRPVISKEEADELIEEIPQIETVWIANEKERENQYKAALQTCDCTELVKVIKTLYLRKKSRIRDGKKATAVDERYLYQAEEQLYGEMAYVLDMEKDNMGNYITERISKVSVH